MNHPACESYCHPTWLYASRYSGRCEVSAASGRAPAAVLCFLDRCPPPTDGRRPEGYAHPLPDPSHSVAQAWLVASAAIEHASVTAFVHLARELTAHDAPSELVARALAAADDERRHTAAKCELARQYGVEVSLPEVAPPPVRALATLAQENAVEGCVRETWGALLATWQGAHAADTSARAALATIAADESRHAELAWAVDAWARSHLSPGESDAVAAARAEAVAVLAAEVTGTHDPALGGALGAPSPQAAAQMFEAARAALWS